MNEADLQFANPPLDALRSNHREFAMSAGLALKYPREVTPFAVLLEDSREASGDLLSLMEPGEATYVVSERPVVLPGLGCEGPFGVLQMTYAAGRELPVAGESFEIEKLSCADADEMVGLTAVAFPGFFRRRTCEMGRYYGIREAGRLVAMCGERMAIGEFREISGLCTHPDVRGRGYAPLLMTQLMRDHREAGLRSYLHVSGDNTNAAALYLRMGFDLRGEFPLQRVTRL